MRTKLFFIILFNIISIYFHLLIKREGTSPLPSCVLIHSVTLTPATPLRVRCSNSSEKRQDGPYCDVNIESNDLDASFTPHQARWKIYSSLWLFHVTSWITDTGCLDSNIYMWIHFNRIHHEETKYLCYAIRKLLNPSCQ